MPPGADCIIDILGVFVRSKLSYTNNTQKETLKNVFLTLVRPHFSWFLPVFYAHCPSKPLNAGKQEKPQKLPPVQVKCNFLRANKLNTNPPKATFYRKLQCLLHLRTCQKKPPRSANQSGKQRKARSERVRSRRAGFVRCRTAVFKLICFVFVSSVLFVP